MAHLENYVIHGSATPPWMRVDEIKIDIWHMAPKKLPDGSFRYMGKTYPSLNDAPIKPLHRGKFGNGWDRPGYCVLIHRDGTTTILVEIDGDQYIADHEMTWGASGINSSSVHVMLEGGWLKDGAAPTKIINFFDLYTDEQWYALRNHITEFIGKHPQVKVSGHNSHSKKLCPGFYVSHLMDDMGLLDYALK